MAVVIGTTTGLASNVSASFQGKRAAEAGAPTPQEVIGFVQLLDAAHYNRSQVQKGDATKDTVAGMMELLDPEHIVFESEDVGKVTQKAAQRGGVYNDLRLYGSLSLATEIYDIYRARWEERRQLVERLLAGELNAGGDYDPTAVPQAWPGKLDERAWTARLRWELNVRMVAEPDEATVRKQLALHYNTLVANARSATIAEIDELYLQAYAKRYDGHTTYYSRESFEDFADGMKGIVGVGFSFKNIGDQCVVESVMPGGPSAGLIFAHDRILAIGSPTGSLNEVVALPERAIARLTRGQPGTAVTLKVLADPMTAKPMPRAITLTRASVNQNADRVRAAVFDLALEDHPILKLGVIRLPALYGELGQSPNVSASKDVAAALRTFAAANIGGVVLDLRHNGGGYLTEAIDVAGLFVPGKAIVQVRNYNGEVQIDESDVRNPTYGGPLVVLVDSATASGAEIIAGALQDYGRALVIGEGRTRGVGTIQQVVTISQILPSMRGAPTGAIKFTIQQFFLPSGRTTQLKGITPDIVLHGIDNPLDEREAETASPSPSSLPATAGAPRAFDTSRLARLRAASDQRQKTMPEFDWLRRRQKALTPSALPLAPAAWRTFVQSQSDIRAALNAEEHRLAAQAYHCAPVTLPGAESDLSRKVASPDRERLDPTEYADFQRFDVPLREALRTVAAMAIGGRDDQRQTNK